ncbi:MAG TPA: ribosome-associated translation inhibitor RaiA [Candidatus Kapabacteria bacterium]|nr:ribosome-associated translation inhibitor RaiA [Candidatus Kapabacteria bacterium]
MNIQTTVRHDTSGGGIKNFVEAELARLEAKFTDIISAEVIIDQEGTNGYLKTVDINIKVPGTVLHVKEQAEEIHKAIDLAVKELEKILRKYKETHLKTNNLRRQQGQEIPDTADGAIEAEI